MPSPWFPLEYRDEIGWKNDGFCLTTTSRRAAKLFDAAISQVFPEFPEVKNYDALTYFSVLSQ